LFCCWALVASFVMVLDLGPAIFHRARSLVLPPPVFGLPSLTLLFLSRSIRPALVTLIEFFLGHDAIFAASYARSRRGFIVHRRQHPKVCFNSLSHCSIGKSKFTIEVKIQEPIFGGPHRSRSRSYNIGNSSTSSLLLSSPDSSQLEIFGFSALDLIYLFLFISLCGFSILFFLHFRRLLSSLVGRSHIYWPCSFVLPFFLAFLHKPLPSSILESFYWYLLVLFCEFSEESQSHPLQFFFGLFIKHHHIPSLFYVPHTLHVK
jgi:hypothetical protein